MKHPFDLNEAFVDLHQRLRAGNLTRDEHDRRLKSYLILAGKIPVPASARNATAAPEVSGNISYAWGRNGKLSITVLSATNTGNSLTPYPRHIRQAARIELQDGMTHEEAAKLRVASDAGIATFEAVLDDLLGKRAEMILQAQGPEARRAVNLDERFQLGDNPDIIHKDQLRDFIDVSDRTMER